MISKGAGLAPLFLKDWPLAEDDPALQQRHAKCDFLLQSAAIFGCDVGLCRLKKNEKKRILLAVMDAPKTKRFSFLGEEQFAVLTPREKLAYLAAAMTELQRSSRPVSTPRQPEERESQGSCV